MNCLKITIQSLFFIITLILTVQLSAQCIEGDCNNGYGTFVYPSKTKYTGEFRNGEIHGKGICYYSDGSIYEGDWKHRHPDGYGIKTYPDGKQREGYWLEGYAVNRSGNIEFSAKGDVPLENEDIQSGCIQGNCQDGQGIYLYIDGNRYEGQFRNGKLNGIGIWYYTDGDVFYGTFKNNYSDGEGVIVHPDGQKTRGVWKEGEFMDKSGVEREGCLEGDCNNGMGTFFYKQSRAKYIGEFSAGIPSGTGTCVYGNGERYEGQWRDGSFNGQGTLFLADGGIVNGLWRDGEHLGNIQPNAQPAEVNRALNTKVWAVLVGIANYGHMPPLKYTDDDAYKVLAHLKSPEGGALSNEQVEVLIDEAATKEEITNAMKRVFAKAGENDLVLLYFSGHGLKGSFLPIDFDGYNNKLFHKDINEIFKSSRAKYKLCIADACHSGSILTNKGLASTLDRYYEALAQSRAGTAFIMSSEPSETSLESNTLRQGVFSHFLIRGLRGEADTDGNGIVTVSELYRFIHSNVRTYTAYRQTPVALGTYDDNMMISVVRD